MIDEPPDSAAKRRQEPASPSHAGVATVDTIQYLRALAASLVVFHHAMAVPAVAPYYAHPFGAFGVDLFFLISGYIMWTTTVGGRRGPGLFWAARIVRIVPLYWIYSTLFVAVALVMPSALSSKPALDPLFVLRSYLFIPTIESNTGNVVPVYSLGWTLNYEMFFYLIFGLGLFIPARAYPIRAAFLAAIFLTLVLLGRLTHPTDPILATYTDPILLEFLAGVALAMAARPLMQMPRVVAALLILIGFSLVGYTTWMATPPTRVIAYGIPATLILAGAIAFERTARSSPSRFALLLGAASYSIYLAHPFAERAWLLSAGKVFFGVSTLGPAFYVASIVAAGMLGGVLSYLLIEKRLIAYGHRLISRHSATNLPAVTLRTLEPADRPGASP